MPGKLTITLIILSFLSNAPFAQSEKNSASTYLVIKNVTVIDATGAAPKPNMTVIISDGRIKEISKSDQVKIPKGATVLNGDGKYLIPGLWDMHVHLSWTSASALPVLAANGVTSVRDLGGRLGELDEWRTKINSGLIVGPRIMRAGPILNGQAFNPLQMVVGTPDETRGIIRALKQIGVDFIKFHRRTPRESYFAGIDEAKKQGLMVFGHIPMTVKPEEASDAGQTTLEHTETLFEGTFAAALNGRKLPDAIRQFRAEEAEKLFARFVKNQTAVTPTLVAYHSIIESADGSLAKNPLSRYVALSFKKAAQEKPIVVSAEDLAGIKETFAELREVVRQMNRSGVILLTGSDIAATRIPGFSLHDELALLVESGLTPMQAIQAATLNPAKILKKGSDLGTIEPNKIADLILLDANPLENIHNTQKINSVILNGKLFNRKALDALLAEGERLAAKN